MSSWTQVDTVLLRSVIDRIIPADDWPSASALGVDRYILNQLTSGAVEHAEAIGLGLKYIDRLAHEHFRSSLQDLSQDRLDLLLKAEEGKPWFAALVELAAEGFYANPSNGGNREAISWQMIGYEHRLPEGPDGPPLKTTEGARQSGTGDVPDDLDVERPVETGMAGLRHEL